MKFNGSKFQSFKVFGLGLLFLTLNLEPRAAHAATGCNYPTSMDAYSDKQTGDFLTTGDVNSRSCAIEKLENGPLRPFSGTVSAPGYSFAGDTGTGMYRVSAGVIGFTTSGTATLNITSGGTLRVGNSATTGVGTNNVVFRNTSGLQWINNANTSAGTMLIQGTVGDALAFTVPSGGVYDYSFGATCPANLCFRIVPVGSAGSGLFFITEGTDPGNTPANGAMIYTKDNGAGKTQLCVNFSSGAAQCFATQP